MSDHCGHVCCADPADPLHRHVLPPEDCPRCAAGADVLLCESCGVRADLALVDGSTWCICCDLAARDLGYDNLPACVLST